MRGKKKEKEALCTLHLLKKAIVGAKQEEIVDKIMRAIKLNFLQEIFLQEIESCKNKPPKLSCFHEK